MVERAADQWPVDRASDPVEDVSGRGAWARDQADRIQARIDAGGTLLAWVAPSEGDPARVADALALSLARRRVVRLSVAMLAPDELATELAAAFVTSEAGRSIGRRGAAVLLLEGVDGLLPAAADWLAAVHARASAAGHAIVLTGRSEALVRRILERGLPAAVWVGSTPADARVAPVPAPVVVPAPDEEEPAGEPAPAPTVRAEQPDEAAFWIVLPEGPGEPPEAAEGSEAGGLTPAARRVEDSSATVLAFPTPIAPPAVTPTPRPAPVPAPPAPPLRRPAPSEEEARRAETGRVETPERALSEWPVEARAPARSPATGLDRRLVWGLVLLLLLALPAATMLVRSLGRPEERPVSATPAGAVTRKLVPDRGPARSVAAAPPEASGATRAERSAREARAPSRAAGPPVLFDEQTGRLSLHLEQTPLYEALMLIGWQAGIRFETDLPLLAPVDLIAADLPVRDALSRLLASYQVIALDPDPNLEAGPRAVWVLAEKPGPAPVDAALQTLLESPDAALRDAAVTELAALGRSSAAFELRDRVERAASIDTEEAELLAAVRERIESVLCREGNALSVGPQATNRSCD